VAPFLGTVIVRLSGAGHFSGAASRLLFAGDATRNDSNQTKFELEWCDTRPGGHYSYVTRAELKVVYPY
jgi:hypothetical protein